MISRGRGRRASSLVPGMVQHLRLPWRDDLPIEDLLRLRAELDEMLGRIRSTRHIANPVLKCPACGRIGRGADPRISVQTTILAVARFGVAAREPALALEKAWTTYRKTVAASRRSSAGGSRRTQDRRRAALGQ
jgi:hypothetical protein